MNSHPTDDVASLAARLESTNADERAAAAEKLCQTGESAATAAIQRVFGTNRTSWMELWISNISRMCLRISSLRILHSTREAASGWVADMDAINCRTCAKLL